MNRTEEEKIADEIDLALFRVYELAIEMREKAGHVAWVLVAHGIKEVRAEVRTRMSATRRAETRG